jgi:hypothetical protein
MKTLVYFSKAIPVSLLFENPVLVGVGVNKKNIYLQEMQNLVMLSLNNLSPTVVFRSWSRRRRRILTGRRTPCTTARPAWCGRSWASARASRPTRHTSTWISSRRCAKISFSRNSQHSCKSWPGKQGGRGNYVVVTRILFANITVMAKWQNEIALQQIQKKHI